MERSRARRRFERGEKIEAQEEGREERRRRGGRGGMEDRSGRAGRVTYKKNAMDDFFFPFTTLPKTERDRAERPRTGPRDRLVLSCPRTNAAEGKGGIE